MAQRESSLKTEDQILKTARDIFSKKGWESTNLQDIADALGVTRGPIYYRFKNKTILFDAMLKNHMDGSAEKTRKILAQPEPFFNRLETMLITWITHRKSHAFLNDLVTNPELSQSRKYYTRVCEDLYLEVLNYAQKGILEGDLKPDTNCKEVVEMVFIFFNGIVGLMNSPVNSLCKQNPHQAVKTFVEYLSIIHKPQI